MAAPLAPDPLDGRLQERIQHLISKLYGNQVEALFRANASLRQEVTELTSRNNRLAARITALEDDLQVQVTTLSGQVDHMRGDVALLQLLHDVHQLRRHKVGLPHAVVGL